MDIIRILLLLTSIAIIVGPIGGAVIIYRDNMASLVVPDTQGLTSSWPTAEYVDSQYDLATQTVSLRFSVTNPFNISLTLKVLSADVYCSDHHTPLGEVSISGTSKVIPQRSSALIVVVVTYTQAGENHIHTSHAGQTSMYVDLKNLRIEIQGIDVHYEGQIDHIGPIQIA